MYNEILIVSVIGTAVSQLLNRATLKSKIGLLGANDGPFTSFQTNYLIVYLLAVSADWLQGPYVYALYSHYGFSKNVIGRLYIAGFASSAIFGTFLASLADKYGRRNNALLYAFMYTTSCLTKHSSNFYWLLLGRILGGIGYSILWSAFESWMVYEHVNRGFEPVLLSHTFSKAQYWNGVVAICSGQTAGWFASRFGKVMPFDVSAAVLVVLSIIIIRTWTENYGDSEQSVKGGFSRAWTSLISDEKILLLGISQSAFEGAMYTFTFVWTPALQAAKGQVGEIPHGTIFSAFMAATMMGSNLFSILSKHWGVEKILRNVFFIGTLLFATITISSRIEVVYGAFLLFEVLCGIYFPGMATMRAPYIPEESRSSLLTLFRVPLNIIVVITLYEDMKLSNVFLACAVLMAIATFSQQRLLRLVRCSPESGKLDEDISMIETGVPS